MRQILQNRDYQREEVLESTFGNLKVSQPDSKGDLETHQLSQRTEKILKPAQSPTGWSIPRRCRLLGTSTSAKIKVACVFQRESFEDGLNCKPGTGRFKGIWENICTIEEGFKLFCSYESSWLMYFQYPEFSQKDYSYTLSATKKMVSRRWLYSTGKMNTRGFVQDISGIHQLHLDWKLISKIPS